jgi:hypothetical protein
MAIDWLTKTAQQLQQLQQQHTAYNKALAFKKKKKKKKSIHIYLQIR